jgi:hypothetical protein
MPTESFRRFTVADERLGDVHLLVPFPSAESPWGALEPLQDTEWGAEIPAVSGAALSDALHGWALPLMRQIGVPPQIHAKRISEDAGRCALSAGCIGSEPHCRPGPDLPECYEAPGAHTGLTTAVALAWAEGRYVVVVEGAEFSIQGAGG